MAAAGAIVGGTVLPDRRRSVCLGGLEVPHEEITRFTQGQATLLESAETGPEFLQLSGHGFVGGCGSTRNGSDHAGGGGLRQNGHKVFVPQSAGHLQVGGAQRADEFTGNPPQPGRLGDADLPAIATLLKIPRVRHRSSSRRSLWRAWHSICLPNSLPAKGLRKMVETKGLEPSTSAVRVPRSPN